jgi:hypothetical protein
VIATNPNPVQEVVLIMMQMKRKDLLIINGFVNGICLSEDRSMRLNNSVVNG